MTDPVTVDVGEVTVGNRAQRRAAEKGYKPGRKILVLDFEGTEHDGLEARCRTMRFGQMMDLARGDLMQLVAEAQDGMTTLNAEQIGQMDGLFSLFADALISWNLLDPETGEPVPATLAGLQSQDTPFVLLVFKVWTQAMASVSGPLAEPSSSGAPSQVGSLPMVPKSPNPPS